MRILKELEEIIGARKRSPLVASYTCKLLSDGRLAARKVSEEAYELSEAALCGTKQELISEAADLLYHVLVLLGREAIELEEVLAVLEARRKS